VSSRIIGGHLGAVVFFIERPIYFDTIADSSELLITDYLCTQLGNAKWHCLIAYSTRCQEFKGAPAPSNPITSLPGRT